MDILLLGVVGTACSAAVAQGWALLHLLGQNGRILTRLDRLQAEGAGSAHAPVPREHDLTNAADPGPPAGPVRRVQPLAIGTRAPRFHLPGVAGRTVSLDGLRGQPTLVFFWNSGCGNCRTLLDQVKDLEARYSTAVPNLLVMASGSVEAIEALELQSTIAIDQTFAMSRALGTTGTPSALVIDADGVIASPVARGVEEVQDLFDAILVWTLGEIHPLSR